MNALFALEAKLNIAARMPSYRHHQKHSLPLPTNREWGHQLLERQMRRLATIQNCIHDVRRQERQPDYPANKRCSDPLRSSDLIQTPVGPVFQQPLPPKRPGNRLDHRIVDRGSGTRVTVGAIRKHNHLSAAAFLEGHRDVDRDHLGN